MKDFVQKDFSGFAKKIGVMSFALLFFSFAFTSQTSAAIVINEIYPSGGAASATYNRDYVELYNNGSKSVDISGYSIQSATTTGTTFTKCNITATDTVIEPGTYFLIQFGTTDVNVGGPIPAPDATCSVNLAASAAKLALVDSTTTLDGTTCPPTGATVVDFVGYGNANCSEMAPAPAPANNKSSIQRTTVGIDTNNNFNDFTSVAPSPFNSLSNDLTISQSAPASVSVGNSYNYTLTVNNAGGTNLTTLEIDFTIPSNVTYNAAVSNCTSTTLTSGGVLQLRGCGVSANSSTSFTINVTAPATTQTITSTGTNVIVDPNNTIAESNENNNTATTVMNDVTVGSTAALVNVGGQVVNFKGRPIAGVLVTLTDGSGNKHSAYTDDSGNYLFEEVEVGQVLVFEARAKRYSFTQPMQVVSLNGENVTVNFVGYEQKRFF